MNGIIKPTAVRLWIIDTWEQALTFAILLVAIFIIVRIAIAINNRHMNQYHLDNVATSKIVERDIIIEEQARRLKELQKDINCIRGLLDQSQDTLKGVRSMIDRSIK